MGGGGSWRSRPAFLVTRRPREPLTGRRPLMALPPPDRQSYPAGRFRCRGQALLPFDVPWRTLLTNVRSRFSPPPPNRRLPRQSHLRQPQLNARQSLGLSQVGLARKLCPPFSSLHPSASVSWRCRGKGRQPSVVAVDRATTSRRVHPKRTARRRVAVSALLNVVPGERCSVCARRPLENAATSP